jgi:hypothetical protein
MALSDRSVEALCIVCSDSVVYRTSSDKWHYETKHTNILLKNQEERKNM